MRFFFCLDELWKLSDQPVRGVSSAPPQSIWVPSQGLYRSNSLIWLWWLRRLLLSRDDLLTEAAVSPAPADATRISIWFISVTKGKKKEATAQEIRTRQQWFTSKNYSVFTPDELVRRHVCAVVSVSELILSYWIYTAKTQLWTIKVLHYHPPLKARGNNVFPHGCVE